MTTVAEEQVAPRSSIIEVHSIDYIPQRERHGKAWHLGALWFMALAELATLSVGLIGISIGANFLWSIIAIVLGAVIGTFFMAFHSLQGPRLGLPQMIQSRPQFGYYGALLPQAIVLFLYVGFTVFNVVIGAGALSAATGLDNTPAVLLVMAVAVVVATVGYRWIHMLTRWGTYVFLVVFGVFTVGVLATVRLPAEQLDASAFDIVPFLVVFGVVAAYQLSIAPYVSDYSRYLPRDIPARPVFWWTYLGTAIGAIWLMGLGAYLLAANPDQGPIDAVRAGGDAIFMGFGPIALIVGLVGMVAVAAINIYGGSLVAIGILDTVRQVKPTVTIRLTWIAVVTVIATAIALSVTEDFLTAYNNFLLVLLYSLTPWTAINLVDYYFVRRGEYAIREIFNPNGMYGRWGKAGLIAYAVSFAAMIPFFSTGLYTGPAAEAMGGADIAMFIGLPVAAIVYWALTRGLDIEAEHTIAERSNAELDAE